jgi:hypothetical protein
MTAAKKPVSPGQSDEEHGNSAQAPGQVKKDETDAQPKTEPTEQPEQEQQPEQLVAPQHTQAPPEVQHGKQGDKQPEVQHSGPIGVVPVYAGGDPVPESAAAEAQEGAGADEGAEQGADTSQGSTEPQQAPEGG